MNIEEFKIFIKINGISKLKSGTLCFYGDWFGRPMDNIHQIVEVLFTEKTIIIKFDQNEILTLEEPKEIIVKDKIFKIKQTVNVKWEWYYDKELNKDKYFKEYYFKDNSITRKTNIDWDEHYSIDIKYPAIEIC